MESFCRYGFHLYRKNEKQAWKVCKYFYFFVAVTGSYLPLVVEKGVKTSIVTIQIKAYWTVLQGGIHFSLFLDSLSVWGRGIHHGLKNYIIIN